MSLPVCRLLGLESSFRKNWRPQRRSVRALLLTRCSSRMGAVNTPQSQRTGSAVVESPERLPNSLTLCRGAGNQSTRLSCMPS
eukprot:3897054-Amphidinium_carterae.1